MFARQTMNVQLSAKQVVFLDIPILQPWFITLAVKVPLDTSAPSGSRVYGSTVFQKLPRSSSPVCNGSTLSHFEDRKSQEWFPDVIRTVFRSKKKKKNQSGKSFEFRRVNKNQAGRAL